MKIQTDITVLMDRSGSMNKIKEATIAGYNKFLKSQREIKGVGEACITYNQFDDKFDTLYTGISVQHAADIDENSYIPRD